MRPTFLRLALVAPFLFAAAATASAPWTPSCLEEPLSHPTFLQGPPVEVCYAQCRPDYDLCRVECRARGENEFVCFRECISLFWGCVGRCMAGEGVVGTTPSAAEPTTAAPLVVVRASTGAPAAHGGRAEGEAGAR